ncbi:inorganic phosphate transporter [Candidatus Villigracilis saccharophilus]|uniref:inorganic phosphate transporter n=1 Tax=Candidatus Villigracilis saccharophilus TaxID=3140684 RepID=UPI003134B0AF|nr:inorganic phosphate transporter [Anaerolineales bacterium]
MSPELIFVIILAVVFDFLNGVHDSSNIVATMIASRAFRPQTALALTATAEFLGPFLFGVTVAKTIGEEVAQASALNLDVIVACLIGAIVWNLLTWFFGIPSSSSHALIGGIVGAVLAGAGFGAIKLQGLGKVVIALFTSPLIGFAAGFLITRLIYFLARNATPDVNWFFKNGQFVTALGMAFSHGTNDAQKTMGIITLSLVISGNIPGFQVPFWVIIVSASAIALGTALGGWRLIRTLGGKFYKIRPVHSFSTQLTSGIVILTASVFGLPVSTSQVVSSAIIGVGSSERLGKVRWSVAQEIVTAWFITIPASALFSAGIYWLITLLK